MLSRFGFEKKAIAVFLAGLLALGGVVSLGQGAIAAPLPDCTTNVSDLFDSDNDGFLEINDAEDLIKLSISQEVYRNSDVAIRSDLDVSDCDWLPIYNFSGTLDGNNYEITFESNNPGSGAGYLGFFETVIGGTVKDLVLSGSLSCSSCQNYVGGLAGYIEEGTLDNITTSVDVYAPSHEYVGGLVGFDYDSDIRNSSSTGNVEGMSSVGGLIGSGANTQVENSFTSGNVKGQEYVGGLVGLLYTDIGLTATIADCFAIGTIESKDDSLGGLLGQAFDKGQGIRVIRSHFSGTIRTLGTLNSNSGSALLVGYAATSTGGTAGKGVFISNTVARDHLSNSLFVQRGDLLVGFGTVMSQNISTRISSDMQDQSFFKDSLGWDFDSIWTMSPLSSSFQGFPILQWQVIDSGSGGGSGGSGGSGSFAGLNPTVANSNLFANLQVRRAVTLSGANLNMVVSAEIDSKKALIDFRRSTASNLAISRLPLLPSGQYQLRLLDAAGQLVAEVPITIKAKFKNVRGFGSEAELSADLRKAMRQAARTYPAANSVRCWGVTTGNSASDLAAARQRAEAACEYLASRDPDLETEVRFRSGKGKPAVNQAVRLRFFK